MSEEKAKKAMIDAARLADELRGEQEMAQQFERERKLLECHVKDIQARLDESESNALKGGKKAMNKMDSRIRELESELDAENRRMADAVKNLPMQLTRTAKTMNVCKGSLISFSPRSDLTRSRLRKQRKSLL